MNAWYLALSPQEHGNQVSSFFCCCQILKKHSEIPVSIDNRRVTALAKLMARRGTMLVIESAEGQGDKKINKNFLGEKK